MSVIDIDGLLGDVTAEAPCGEDLEYDPGFSRLESMAQEKPERQYGGTIIPAEPPDWVNVKKTAVELLARTHDLRITVYLTRALLNTDGLQGFSDGLSLLRGLIEKSWEGLYPRLDPDDDNDPTSRINIISALIDPETTLRNIREMPLVVSRIAGRFSFRDMQIAAGVLKPIGAKDDKTPPPEQNMIDSAFQDVDLMVLRDTALALAQSRDNATAIEAAITDRVGILQSINLSSLRDLMQEMYVIVAGWLARRGYVEPSAEPEAPEADADMPGADADQQASTAKGPKLVVGELNNREDVIRMLDKLCEYFARHEPSSPVPFLLKRAKRLMDKDFMEVLRDLAPGGTDHAKVILGLDEQTLG